MSLDRYLERVRVCHTLDAGAFVPWYVAGHERDGAVGRVHRTRVPLLLRPPTPFQWCRDQLVLAGPDFAARSAGLAELVARLARAGAARAALGEFYPVVAPGGGAPLLQLDRSVITWFGVRARGVHLNGFVGSGRALAMWVARRARDKRTFPGHLDNLVAGGQSIGLDARTTLVKECREEAGIDPALAARALAVGEIRYVHQDGYEVKADTLACFDLELPPEFVPRAVDGEVESFALWSVQAVLESLRGQDLWKPNCALVVLHFLLRSGQLDDELDGAARARLWAAVTEEGA